MKGWLPHLLLLAVAAVLGTWVWIAPPPEEQSRPLAAGKSAGVQRVTLERPGQSLIELERHDARWLLTAPLRARADEFQVMRILALLETKPAAQFPATDLERFDLQAPVARLTVDGEEYAFGGINAVTREQYVMRGDTVFAVALRHGAALPGDAMALVRRVLLHENEIPAAILLPQFSVRQTGERWSLTPPADGAGADELQAFIDRWRQASAARAEPHDGRKPLAEVRIELQDGAPLVISVLQHEPNLVLWRHDNGLQYTFLAGAGQALLAHPGHPVSVKNIK
ncbi:MAG: DUF4340 domain-containing protein [Burkholderiales bacterium]|nr:DUF4340 domain-containing protein [Burkholderiales bacterium]